MSYPPTPPPSNRANNTPMVDNHPMDHDTLSLNISDLIAELGPKPAGFDGLDLTGRLAWFTYKADLSGVVMSVPNVPGQAGFVFRNGTTPIFTVSPTAATFTTPVALAAGGISTDVILNGEGVGHRLMLGSASPYQYFKGGDGLLHWNVDGVDIMLMNPAGGLTLAGGPTIIPRTGGFLDISASAVSLFSAAGQTHLIHSGPSGSQGADLSVANNSVRVAGTTTAETWTDRPLVVTTKAGSGQVGIGFSNQASNLQGQLYLYNQPTLAFDFRDANNTAWLPLRASAFNVSSSARFKDGIVPLDGGALDVIDRLRPSTYFRDGHEELGLIAEEVDGVFPLAVGHDAEGPALLDVQQLVVLALAGIAELNRKLA